MTRVIDDAFDSPQSDSMEPWRPIGLPIETYLRATITVPGGSIEAGLQRRVGEPLRTLRLELVRVLLEEALTLNGDDLDEDNGQRLTDAIHARLTATWPERAWFAELWIADEAISQVYAPWGMPRVR